jgi:hypothetical protein
MTNATDALEKAFEDALRCFPADLPDEERQRIREDLRLQFDHPGRYVAYLDVWEEHDGAPVLTRQVVHTGDSYPDVWEAARSHPRADLLVCEFVNDPLGPLDPILPD